MREPDIILTIEEQVLYRSIRFDWKHPDDLEGSLERMSVLAQGLLDRSAVPAARISYFHDPEFNPGARGRSRNDVFAANGTSGSEVLSHPNFLRHLEYFVCGPDLPVEAIERFRREAQGSGYLTNGDINDLAPYARSFVRSSRLHPHHASEEFFKLAIECGATPSAADSLRRSVRAVKWR